MFGKKYCDKLVESIDIMHTVIADTELKAAAADNSRHAHRRPGHDYCCQDVGQRCGVNCATCVPHIRF